MSSVTASADLDHGDRRREPRDIRVFAITKRTGYSKTSARKMPTKTIKNVSPIAAKATARPSEART